MKRSGARALVNDDVITPMSHFIAASTPCVLWKRNPSQRAYVAFLVVLFILIFCDYLHLMTIKFTMIFLF